LAFEWIQRGESPASSVTAPFHSAFDKSLLDPALRSTRLEVGGTALLLSAPSTFELSTLEKEEYEQV
jgi:hypothetical protein